MTGHIQARGDHLWRLHVHLGYVDGRRRTVTRTVKGPYEAAEEILGRLLAEVTPVRRPVASMSRPKPSRKPGRPPRPLPVVMPRRPPRCSDPLHVVKPKRYRSPDPLLPPCSHRFPLKPLLALFPARWATGPDGVRPVGPSSQLAQAVGVTLRTVYRHKHTGLDEWAADRWAVACGRHPGDLWPEWWPAEEAVTGAA